MKFGTLVQHAFFLQKSDSDFLIFAQRLRDGLSNPKKKKTFERSWLSPRAKIENFESIFCRSALLHSAKTVFVFSESLNS